VARLLLEGNVLRDLKDYSKKEWFRLKPPGDFLIDFCNDSLQYGFRACRPRSLTRFLQDAGHLKGRNICLVVAYEQPWTLDWLLRMAARHLSDATLLVFDNSRRAKARLDIERVCRDAGAAYLGLPPNPTRHPNRSHGMAMTWIFHNVVRKIRPRNFTFIDHDLIPMEKIELSGIVGDQPFYGLARVRRWGWSLWAGYCSYDFSAVHHAPLNFLNDFSRELDTGGRNWFCLYRNFDRALMRFASMRPISVVDPLHGTPRRISVIDDSWIHLGGAGYSASFPAMRDFYERMAKAADEGATLRMLAANTGANPP
jgi:hypothetical protein